MEVPETHEKQDNVNHTQKVSQSQRGFRIIDHRAQADQGCAQVAKEAVGVKAFEDTGWVVAIKHPEGSNACSYETGD
jgi:hypothetical protein